MEQTTGRGAVVVPTLGASPHLRDCLEALRRSGGDTLQIVLVGPAEILDSRELEQSAALADTVIRLDRNLGFAGNNNRALAEIDGQWVALVNDDAIVEPDWWSRLVETLDRHGDVAAVQGVVVDLSDSDRIDGHGLSWNRHWQAVQLGHGRPVGEAPDTGCEIFGVSATAAVFRRRALEAVSVGDAQPFDPGLFAYYEDVDLAVRLREAGWRAWLVPEARAAHAGSLTGEELEGGKGRLLVANRWLVLMRLFGRGFWRRLPGILARDLRDVGRALLRGRWATLGVYASGWRRALTRSPSALHGGPPRVPPMELERFRVES